MNASPRYKPEAQADVCLLLEGTYPYVRGGVSTWVRQLIEGMPHLTFSVVYLGADSETHSEAVYQLPGNLVHLETHFLLDPPSRVQTESVTQRVSEKLAGLLRSVQCAGSAPARFARSDSCHAFLRDTDGMLDARVADEFAALLCGDDAVSAVDLETHRAAWNSIRAHYAQAPEELDFNHYFWSVRSMHAPLFTLAQIARNAPVAAVYHSVSTGYAGYLGSLIRQHKQIPFIITEHGIYTKERELDLAQVDWIPENHDPFNVGLNDNMNYLRSLWIRFFGSLARMAYASAEDVFTLYDGNRKRQIADGADPDRLHIVPNGVDIERFARVRRAEHAPIPPVIALVGRVVPIKDIKTFIRTMQIIHASMPEVEGWLYGPDDEDPEYTRECRDLIRSLGLGKVVKFKGFDKPERIFPKVGLSVLSSVSEGQPLVVLEGFAAGIPAVTTDVGSCRGLVYGVGDADQGLGRAGEVVPISNPEALAGAAMTLLSSASSWHAASRCAIERVERYYSDVDMINRYAQVYAHYQLTDSEASRRDIAEAHHGKAA